ncbi:hypothetical protein [Bradyrhizobium retamae]|uniref:Uncharacterized protein n=1 Tax=Bradyrhizobium retamae TaxID=1300035 RepID=A0A0R3NJT0_9BRAD|nr:hypothetical protein [Bradyrhizobium retamae]KRR30384.1 hypothetical protein CQ13_01680 [Bradyrhizobium retamae]
MSVEQVELPEIQIEDRLPTWLRLCISVGAIFFVACLAYEFAAEPGARTWSNAGKLLVAIFFCGVLIWNVLLSSKVRWTIRNNEIQIDKAWIYDRQEVEFVRSGEIALIKVDSESDDSGISYYIRLELYSGREIKSPPIANAQRARALKAEIANHLNVPHEYVTPRT